MKNFPHTQIIYPCIPWAVHEKKIHFSETNGKEINTIPVSRFFVNLRSY